MAARPQTRPGREQSRAQAADTEGRSHPLIGKRILIVTGYFPPYAPPGATRAPHLASHWRNAGVDVRVLSAANPHTPHVLEHDLPDSAVFHVPYTRVGSGTQMLRYRLLGRVPPPPLVMPAPPDTAGGNGQSGTSTRSGLRAWLSRQYHQLLFLPDHHVYWAEQALGHVERVYSDWRPDLIYASSPPHSGQILAGRLADRWDVPWIAELRDAWAHNPYTGATRLRAMLEAQLEEATLEGALALVALTSSTKARLEDRYAQPVGLAMNGFEPTDFAGLAAEPLTPGKLSILHAGSIYAGKRDPAVLFDAVRRLGGRAQQVEMLFYGDAIDAIPALAERYGVAGQVKVAASIQRPQVLALERQVDVLLLCRWNDPREDGIIPGKLFEYVGARRPILAIGSETGEAADIVRDGGFGLVSNNPEVIHRQLDSWLEQKMLCPRLPDLSAATSLNYTRSRQFEQLSDAISGWLAALASDHHR